MGSVCGSKTKENNKNLAKEKNRPNTNSNRQERPQIILNNIQNNNNINQNREPFNANNLVVLSHRSSIYN